MRKKATKLSTTSRPSRRKGGEKKQSGPSIIDVPGGTMMYLTHDFQPSSKDDYDMVKISYFNGGMKFGLRIWEPGEKEKRDARVKNRNKNGG